MSTDRSSQLQLVESTYDLGAESGSWADKLGSMLRETIDGVVTCFAFEVLRSDEGLTLGWQWAEDERVQASTRHLFDGQPDEFLGLFFGQPLMATTSREILDAAKIPLAKTPLPHAYEALGAKESFGVSACDPSGNGVVFGTYLDSLCGPTPAQRAILSQVAAHIASSTRLRRGLGAATAIDYAAAILSPAGKLEHATLATAGAAARLADAVKRVEHARTRARDAREALELWQGLVDGTWSLVDYFEGSGRRYYVAVQNSAETAVSKKLTRREAEVVAYLASGTTTKDTAYALGLEVVTVRGHMRTAMIKLGVRNRSELISLRSVLMGEQR